MEPLDYPALDALVAWMRGKGVVSLKVHDAELVLGPKPDERELREQRMATASPEERELLVEEQKKADERAAKSEAVEELDLLLASSGSNLSESMKRRIAGVD